MHQLKLSCGLTLALKYKLKTKSKVFKKFGKLLADPATKLGFICLKSFTRLDHKIRFSGEKNTLNYDELINHS